MDGCAECPRRPPRRSGESTPYKRHYGIGWSECRPWSCPSGAGEATVYHDVLTGDETILGAGEEHNQVGYLLRQPEAAKRYQRGHLSNSLFAQHALRHLGANKAWRHCVRKHALGGVIQRQDLGEPRQG